MVYTINGCLYHHGILGQKWGKQNGPPYPLDEEDHSRREKQFGYKKSIGGGSNEELYEKNRQKVNKVEGKASSASSSSGSGNTDNKESSTSDTKDSKSSEKKQKLNYRDKLIKKYMDNGMAMEEAEAAADKKIKVMKGVAIGAGVAALTIAGAVAYKKYGYQIFDKVIPKGTKIQTISEVKNRMDVGESFYTSITKGDKQFYSSEYFTPGGKRLTPGVAQKIGATATGKMKIASERSGIKAMTEVLKSNDKNVKDDLRKSVVSAMGLTGATPEEYSSIANKLEKGLKLTSKEKKLLYDSWNITAVKSVAEQQAMGFSGKAKTAIYEQLKKSGYSGFLDMNDIKFGKISDAATVMIDRGKLSAQKTISALTSNEMAKNSKSYYRKYMTKQILGQPGVALGAASLAGMAGMKASTNYDQKQIRKGLANLSLSERKSRLEKQANKYFIRSNYITNKQYEQAKANWVKSQLKRIEKESKKG